MGNEVIIIGRVTPEITALSTQIRRAGMESTIIADVKKAKKRLNDSIPGLAVVAVEGVADPLELVREMTFLFRGLPVLAATTKGSVNEAREAIQVGAAEYLLLPVEKEVLSAHLKRYVNQYFDPELGRGRHLITGDSMMLRLLTQIRRVAGSKATVLIEGESGTGKELVARYVHQVSDRSDRPFVAINCAALPENLLESELFGHAKGAFTGAMADRKGKFQQANSGTIFLDEISEMTLNLQAKLLRVLQEGEVDPVGGKSPISLDVRVVASTNRDLKTYAQEGNFREDLYYRLNVFPVQLPPLRKRPTDVVLLAEHFRKRFVQELGRNDIPFDDSALQALKSCAWRGNVRELENVIQRCLLVAEGGAITADDLMIDTSSAPAGDNGSSAADAGDTISMPVGTTVKEMEEILIRHTLDEVDGNRTRAAEILGISIRTLRNKLNEYAARVS
ncbi:MAG: sigma-54-dependent Fis family transcriptional regulator [Magnetococcales bacterium]|nr:sigma-54-dependent Fis family transcriptional regulator [Magnetococcales bacterium]